MTGIAEETTGVRRARVGRPPAPFSLLLGGLIAAFVGAIVFWAIVTPGGEPVADRAPLFATLAGLTSALALMVLAMRLVRAVAWLASALLFAAGFTALWTLPLSFATQQGWLAALGFGVLAVTCVVLGFRTFRA